MDKNDGAASLVRSDALLAQIEAMKNCDNCKHLMNTVGHCALCNRVSHYKTADKDKMTDRWELMDSANATALPPQRSGGRQQQIVWDSDSGKEN